MSTYQAKSQGAGTNDTQLQAPCNSHEQRFFCATARTPTVGHVRGREHEFSVSGTSENQIRAPDKQNAACDDAV